MSASRWQVDRLAKDVVLPGTRALPRDGVTAREREVAELIAQGCSNAEIAATLVVSPYTVQDHIKSLFEKTGVNSRRELVGRIFLDDYLPSLAQHAPLAAGGGFVNA